MSGLGTGFTAWPYSMFEVRGESFAFALVLTNRAVISIVSSHQAGATRRRDQPAPEGQPHERV